MMEKSYINLTVDNLGEEHLCCAIADKKHQDGVARKKVWLTERIVEGHVFRKLDARGKVFIEYTPLEKAWVPVLGNNYLYIHCLWVSGSFKGQGHGDELLKYCIAHAKDQAKSGVCVLSSKKKKPFLSDRKFFEKYGFKTVDAIGDYELLALSFAETLPRFADNAKKQRIEEKELTIFYSPQCPFTLNCIEQVRDYCAANVISVNLLPIDSLEKAKGLPCVFNNWATFYRGEFLGPTLLNEGQLKKLLAE